MGHHMKKPQSFSIFFKLFSILTCGLLIVFSTPPVRAANWSENSIHFRIGNQFREPFNSQNIRKNILGFTHVSGSQYGSNFFNIDLLKSDNKDPLNVNQHRGAQEAYIVYRHTFNFEKLTGKTLNWPNLRGIGMTTGFDWNAKRDIGYNSRKHMLVFGPTLTWDVSGFFNTSLLLLHESNAPSGAFPPISNVKGRHTYKIHPMLSVNWGLPVNHSLAFEGFANFIASKGKNEVGKATGNETNFDMRLMYDISAITSSKPKTLRLGFAYQYWHNKFGNTAINTGGKGYVAKTPMLRMDCNF
jgi:hypothetical protein